MSVMHVVCGEKFAAPGERFAAPGERFVVILWCSVVHGGMLHLFGLFNLYTNDKLVCF